MTKTKKLLIRFIALSIMFVILLSGCEQGNKRKPIDDTPSGKNIYTSEESKATSINTSGSVKKRVAITFDDGPHNVYTKKIVDELTKYGAHSTFFVVGNRVDGTDYNGKTGLKYALDKGNEVGIHGYTHKKYYNKCSDADYNAELSNTVTAIHGVSPKYQVKLMRPVGGHITDARVSACKYSVVMWSIDSEDWKHKYKDSDTEAEKKEKVDTIVNNVMSNVKDGSIILMHDIYGSTYDATAIILERLYAEGYEVVTVSELVGNDLTGGRKYYSVSK